MWSQQVDQWDKDQVNELGPVLGQYKQEMHSFKSDLSQYVSLLEEVSFQIRLLLRTQFLLTPPSRPCHVKAVSLALRGLRRESFSSKFHEFSTAESSSLPSLSLSTSKIHISTFSFYDRGHVHN